MALLNPELLLLLDEQLEGLEIDQLRAQVLVHQRLADVDPRLDDRDHRLELFDGGRSRGVLGLLLRLLTVERGDLGLMLGDLVEQKVALRGDQRSDRIDGRHEIGHGIVAADQCRAQPRDVELLGEQIVVQMIAFRDIHGRIELDQHVAGPDHLPVLHVDRAHHAGLERLDDLGAATRHDLSGGEATMSIVPHHDQASAAQNSSDKGKPRSRGRSATAAFRRFRARPAGMPALRCAGARTRQAGTDAARRPGGNGEFSGLHGSPPAGGATRHSGRRS